MALPHIVNLDLLEPNLAMTSICTQIATLANLTHNENLPQSVWMAAQQSVLDTLAGTIAGALSKNASDTRHSSRSLFGGGTFRAWFAEDEPMHFLGAVLSNCAAASALDIDDGHRGAAGHPGAAIIPAVLMECARRPASGRDALAAIILGYDVALRVAVARRRHAQISFASGIWTAYGVAAAIGRLRGLSPELIAHAIAIAGAESPQNLPQGACAASSVKGSSPWSTVTAFAAVDRAAAGASGSLDLLDRDDVFDTRAILEDLGSRWLIEETYLKPYAACRYTHPVIDAILEIQGVVGPQWNLEKLETVEIDIFPEAARLPNAVAPTSLEDAQFSLPYCAALAIAGGGRAFRPMLPESLDKEAVLAISRRVSINYGSEEFVGVFPAKTPAIVRIRMDGRLYEARVDYPRGDTANPMTMDDIVDKLRELDHTSRADDLIKAVAGLKDGTTEELSRVLSGTSSP